MIRPIDIKLNAAHPELPLVEATTFTGAPSSVFIRGVPKSVGNWSITAVNVAVTYPDNSTTTRAAVESAEGVWVATIPGTATSGRTVAGFRILADGIDENGAAVTGYVLGFADFAVLSFFPIPAPGETFFYLRYFDTMPTAAKKMDVTTIDGILKYYNGTTWLPFAAYDDAVTPTSANGVKSSGIWSAIWGALSALPTGFTSLYDWVVSQLAGKLDKSGGTVTGSVIFGTDPESSPSTWEDTDFGTSISNGGIMFLDVDNDDSGGTRALITGEYEEGLRIKFYRYNTRGNLLYNKSVKFPLINNSTSETIAYISSIPVKAVKVDGTALTPDGNGAVDITGKANRAANPTAGNLASLDANGNPTDSLIPAANVALKGAIPYALVTKTISNNAVTLDDRASNAVTISATLSPNTLTINFPTAPTGKLRDFAMRLNIASGVTAPEIAWPQGVTIENDGGEVPEIADGGTGGSSTILYFSETENNGTTAKFLVKCETLTAIAQA